MNHFKFRGKNNNDKWSYGHYAEMVSGLSTVHVIVDCGFTIYVNPNTVGQFTGISDQSDQRREIYTGDIMAVSHEDGTTICQVVYEIRDSDEYPVFACFYMKRIKDVDFNIDTGYDENEAYFHVIGNIYENPELLAED